MTILRFPRKLQRPAPPELDPFEFRPAPELEEWVRDVFILQDGPLANPRYEPIAAAEFGFLWTEVPNGRAGRNIVGQAELMPPMAMGKWQRARAEWQVQSWFGAVPDFLITIDANYARAVDDASFCALVEHELHHCVQAVDEFGQPRFRKSDGTPIFALQGHDIEEFVGVVERYGTEATGTARLVAAANAGPTVSAAKMAQACGTCQAKRYG